MKNAQVKQIMKILKAAEEAQLDGLFDCADSGIEWLKGVGVI